MKFTSLDTSFFTEINFKIRIYKKFLTINIIKKIEIFKIIFK